MIKKTIITLAALLMNAVLLMAQVGGNTLSLSGRWLFHYSPDEGDADRLTAQGFYQPYFDAAVFDACHVPSCWAILGYEEPVYRGFPDDKASEGLYLKHFQVPASLKGKRMLLHFGGVWNSAEVWLNGMRLGRHDSGYTSFAMDATSAVKPGEDNVLAVRVRQVYPGYKTDTYDDWTLGGIYRDVELEWMPRSRRIDRVTVATRMTGDVDVRVMVADEHKNTLPGNYPSPTEPYQVRLTLTDADGRTVAAETVDVKARASSTTETRRTLHVSSPRLWSAETPYLYTLTAELVEKGTVSHQRKQKIGIREITTAGGVLRINGQPVKLRGVNRHDEYPDVGRAVSREHWLQDLQLMKQANINYVRAAHYQHAKGFIELCDSMGMYVGGEVSLGGAAGLMYNPSFASSVMLRVFETVTRDLNNPSVIYWSVGNEDPVTDMHIQAVRTVKGLDPTRPVLMPWNAEESLPEEIDILAPHYWTAHEYDSLASRSKRPIITTEYVHAYGLQRMGGLEDCWKALTRHPAGAGGAVWMWADQGIKTPVKRQGKSSLTSDEYLRLDAAGWDGITDSYRRPTRDLEEVKAVYCPVEVRNENKGIELYNGYDFLNLNTVRISWQTFVGDKQKAEGETVVSAAPHTTAPLDIDIRKADYLWLTFIDSRGHEMGRRSIELRQPACPKQKVNIAINPATGLPEGFRPTVWHKLNDGDQIIKNRKMANDPEKYTVKVKKTETDGNVIRSVVHYEINDSNSIDARYTVTTDKHAVTIDYEITPHLQTNYVPIVGLAYKMKQPKTLGRWYGLGPDEAYPNKQTAEITGYWNAAMVSGTRRMQWVEADGLRLYCDGYLDRDAADSKEIRLLSHVLGRSEKGRLNYPELQLPQGKAYKGRVIVR